VEFTFLGKSVSTLAGWLAGWRNEISPARQSHMHAQSRPEACGREGESGGVDKWGGPERDDEEEEEEEEGGRFQIGHLLSFSFFAPQPEEKRHVSQHVDFSANPELTRGNPFLAHPITSRRRRARREGKERKGKLGKGKRSAKKKKKVTFHEKSRIFD